METVNSPPEGIACRALVARFSNSCCNWPSSPSIGNGSVSAATGSISGVVYNDIDGDGVQDPGENGVSGRGGFTRESTFWPK